MKRRDVREADQRLGCDEGCEARDQPHRAVAPAGAEYRLDPWVSQGGTQLLEAAGIVPGEVAESLEQTGVALHPISALEDRAAGVERGSVERTRRGYDGDAVAGPEGRRL